MSVLFADGTVVPIPEGHSSLTTSVTLELLSQQGGVLTLPSNVNFTASEFQKYLDIHQLWLEVKPWISPDDETEKFTSKHKVMVTRAITAMKVSFLVCDMNTVNLCYDILYAISSKSAYVMSYTYYLIFAIIRMFHDYEPIIKDVLARQYIENVEMLIEGRHYKDDDDLGPNWNMTKSCNTRAGPLYEDVVYEILDEPPGFQDGILLGLDLTQLKRESVKYNINIIAANTSDMSDGMKLDVLVAKYLDGSEMTAPDIREFIELCERLKEPTPFAELLDPRDGWDSYLYCLLDSTANLSHVLSDNVLDKEFINMIRLRILLTLDISISSYRIVNSVSKNNFELLFPQNSAINIFTWDIAFGNLIKDQMREYLQSRGLSDLADLHCQHLEVPEPNPNNPFRNWDA